MSDSDHRFAAALERLQEHFPANQLSTGESILDQHSHDESWHHAVRPDVVVFAESTGDVCDVVRLASAACVPVVPFGVGSGLEGHVIPVRGGISLDLTRMNRVVEIRPDDFLVCVQPGVTRTQLNAALKPHGLFFPVDPGADATLGGMAATNASGTTTVRYGAMKDNVRQLEVVLADGTVIHTGSLAAKSSSGYHLTPLFVGSEGTLGVITELWLRIYGMPEETRAVLATFPDVGGCVRASTAIIGAGIGVARLEFVEAAFMDAINRFKGTDYEVSDTLLLEFHGSAGGGVARYAAGGRDSARGRLRDAADCRCRRRPQPLVGAPGTVRPWRSWHSTPGAAIWQPTCACRFPASRTRSSTRAR